MSSPGAPSSTSLWTLFSARHLGASLMLSGGIALYAIETYVTATIMPSVVRDIGGLPLFAWVTTLYVTASVMGSVFIAIRPRGLSLNRTYSVGAVLFLLGSAICAVAPTMEIVLAGRAVQGFGAGTLATLGYAFIRYVYPESLWNKATTLYAAIWGISTFIGPTLGGFFAEGSAWRHAFAIIVPFALVMGLLAPWLLPAGVDDRTETKAPLKQMILLSASLLLVSFASTAEEIGTRTWLVVCALTAIAALLLVERRATLRILPRGGTLLSMPIARVYAAMFMLLAALTCDIYIPYFLQNLHNVPPLISGYIVALVALGWTVAAFICSDFTGKAMRRSILVGAILEAVCIGMLAVTLARLNPSGDVLLVSAAAFLIFGMGFGVGLGWAHLVTHILHLAEPDEKDKASAGITTVQSLGSAFGAALSGVIVNSTGLVSPGGVEGAASAATWLFMLFALPAVLAAFVAFSLPEPRYGAHVGDND
ncbi:MFS transporter [Rhizobium rhizogenes]|uniref:MFS transporter n=1 Tax=Rhizobium rhizogenes TaxID=359 RepID=A0AA92H8W0_RHIRH|nr:MFS transporter [Rhizobium rhizogenes]PVE63437.1 MFS transporter [Agrobacterium tumefaciens]PVE72328.1 MFS transporter [Sphingomonas sp. TPD3009]